MPSSTVPRRFRRDLGINTSNRNNAHLPSLNSQSSRQEDETDDACSSIRSFVTPSQPFVIRQSEIITETATITLCEDTDQPVNTTSTFDPETKVVVKVEVILGSEAVRGNSTTAKILISFSGLPGYIKVIVQLKWGTSVYTYFYEYDAVGVAIFRNNPSGKPTFYSGNSDNVLKNTGAESYLTFDASAYGGLPGVYSLSRNNLNFSLPDKISIRWSEDGCSLTVTEPSEKLTDDCALGFSTDYTKFYIRLPEGLEAAEPARIIIKWRNLDEFEETAEIGTAVESNVTSGFNDDLTFLQLTKKEPGSSRLVIILVSVGLSVIALSALLFRYFLFNKTKRAIEKTPKFKFGHNLEQWLGMDIPSLRTTAGRTIGVFEDPLSEGMSHIVPTEYGSGYNGSPNYSHSGMDREFSPHEDTENDESILVSEPRDGRSPLERYSGDKSVTKLVLPRGVERGVELESSTDGGSERDIGEEDKSSEDDPGPERVGQSSQATSRQFGDGETGMASDIAGETGTGTVVIGEGSSDSRNRIAIGSAIDRVKQVDMLNGPFTKGLVGKHGLPILQAGPSTEDEGSESRKGPDSSIMTLSSLS